MNKILIALFLLACSVFFFMQMRSTGKRLRTPETPLGILNLEFAYDNDQTTKVLNAWKNDGKMVDAKINTYIDFGLLFFYSLFLFYCCRNLSDIFTGKIRSFGRWLSNAALVAGGLDVIENSGMLLTLGGNQSAVVALLTSICALVKWLLAVIAILYVIFMGLPALYFFIKNEKKEIS